jgi:Flp pilus assembly protein TadG
MIGRASVRDDAGLIGKIAVAWLLILAIVVVGGIDTVSIVITRFHAADVAGNAASDAAANYRLNHSVRDACAAAAAVVQTADPKITIAAHGCTIDKTTGNATVVVRKDASTLIAGRLSVTKKYASVTDTETAPPPTL